MGLVAPSMIQRPPRPEPQTLAITHLTVYRYATPVERSRHQFLLRPLQDELQQVLEYDIAVLPETRGVDFEDLFGNHARRILIDRPYRELRIETRSVVKLTAPPDDLLPAQPLRLPHRWSLWERHVMTPYLLQPDLSAEALEELGDYAGEFARRQQQDLLRTLVDINRTIHAEYRYLSGSTTVATTPFEVFQSRTGVCQDFTNLFVCLARLLGIPARYRVGYIYTGGRNYGNNAQSEATHAWAEVYLPDIGWRGFDPTNGCMAGPDHVRVACGPFAPDATPTSGSYEGGGEETLSVAVKVSRID